MKNFKFYAFVISFFLIISNSAISSDKVAILDLDMLLEKTIHGKKIVADLNLLNEQNLQSLKKIENEIKLNQDNINKQKNILSEEELKKKVSELNSEIAEFQKKKKSLVNNFNLEKNNKLDEFFKKIIPEIEKYINDNNINLVFDKKNIFIANKKNNITDEIVKIIDEKLK
jgi:Outer membrane protein